MIGFLSSKHVRNLKPSFLPLQFHSNHFNRRSNIKLIPSFFLERLWPSLTSSSKELRKRFLNSYYLQVQIHIFFIVLSELFHCQKNIQFIITQMSFKFLIYYVGVFCLLLKILQIQTCCWTTGNRYPAFIHNETFQNIKMEKKRSPPQNSQYSNMI